MPDRVSREFLLLILLVLGLLLGGSNSGGIWANAALQVAALAMLAVMVCTARPGGLLPAPLRGLAWLAGAIVGLPLLQLVPLPPAVWTALPGRGEIAAGFDLAGLARPWLPLSLDPDATLAVLVSLLPPLAVAALAARASRRALWRAMQALAVLALGSAALGLVQRLPGLDLHPYALTNQGAAVGLFANRNHLASLLLAAMPCAALVTRRVGAMLAALAALTGGVLLTGSDAGALLAVPVLALCVLFVRPLWRPRGAVLAGLGVVAAVLVAGAGWQAWRYTQAEPAGGAEQHRPVMIARTLLAARDHAPLGSGGGSFQRIYPRYEDPARIDPEYRNHAHSDYAEVALEYGLPGLLLALAVLGWWGQGVAALVRAGRAADPARGEALAMARAGAVMLGAVLAHSAVDYPLRTAALAMVAALAGVLIARRDEIKSFNINELPEPPAQPLRIAL